MATSKKDGGKVTPIASGIRALGSLVERFNLARLGALQFGGARNLYKVFGYKEKLDSDDFLAKYIRQDIVSRIIDAPPGATWANPPKLMGPALVQDQWDALHEVHDLWGALQRADRLSRLNHFSIILMGLDDSPVLDRPVRPDGVSKLLYLRPMGSRMVDEVSLVNDPRNERFGKPEQYKIKLDDPKSKSISGGTIEIKQDKEIVVHHSRVIHIVENPLEDTIIGVPTIEKIYNLCDDLLKVVGGTSETYWLTANRGLQADVDKDLDFSDEAAEALQDEIEEYQHQLRRWVRTRGVTIHSLGSETPEPKEPFDMIMALLSGTTGIPRRILMGSEAGQLASEQDRANWAERITERRTLFAQPQILRPFVRALQLFKLLPQGNVGYEWPDAFILSPLEQGQSMAQRARAVGNLSRQTGNKLPMQITSREEARKIVGLEGDLPESEIQEVEPSTRREPPPPQQELPGDGNGQGSE